MAEYIRFKWTRAKAGVTMAFLALLGGVVERAANAEAAGGHAASSNPATWTPKLSLGGLTGNLRTSLVRVEKDLSSVYDKDQKAIGALNGNVTELKSNVTELKSQVSGLETNVYDKDAANATFLDKDGTAANSAELGGLTPDSFLHGAGGIATGGGTEEFTSFTPVLNSVDGSLSVSVGGNGNGAAIQITNNTASVMDWVATVAGQVIHGSIGGSGGTQVISLDAGSGFGQATVQFLPAVQTQAFTLIVTEDGTIGNSTGQFAAQMINGGT